MKRYAIATPGIPALPTFIGEDPNNILFAVGTVIIAFVVSFAVAYLFGIKDEPAAEAPVMEKIETENNTIYSPINGNVIERKDIPDPTFAGGVLGEGVGIEPSEPRVYAPFNGTVVMVADTRHALGLQSDDGIQLLIHVGIDTVDMNGDGFDVKCSVGDTIQCGQTLLEFDPEKIKKAGHPSVTAVLVGNSEDYKKVTSTKTGETKVLDKIMVTEP